MASITLNTGSMESYRTFLAAKALPSYRVRGRVVEFPDEYVGRFGLLGREVDPVEYRPIDGLFDYQAAIAELAIRKRKFACFMDCGLGKTLILSEFARHAAGDLRASGRSVLIVCPLMVVHQTIAEIRRFYGDALPVERVEARGMAAWAESPTSPIGITNYDAIGGHVVRGRVGALVLDESSMLKSHYGKWASHLIRIGAGIDWKLCLTGTPAPNDRIEYANHAVFLDRFPTVNSFLATYFVNRGETQNRWELKPHAIRPFYRSLSHWSIFVTNPGTYGWKDNAGGVPPIRVHIHDVELSPEQSEAVRRETGTIVAIPGGIVSRSKLARIAKVGSGSLKPAFIRGLVESWRDERSIVWCKYNDEQDRIASMLPDAASIDGSTPIEERVRLIEEFKAGDRKVLISKPKILGFGLNLQVATRQVFSTLQDSYEEYYQAVKRSNRYGSSRPLDVHVPITDVERPMVETVLRKARQVQADGEAQEILFAENTRVS